MAFIDHIDNDDFDTSVLPSDDFYSHVNGGWLAANPVPAEYPAWGAAYEVHVRNEDALHRILQESVEKEASEGTPVQMVGDYFATGMDEASIDAADIIPLQPYLEGIATVVDLESLALTLIQLQRIGVGAFHSLSVASDFDDAGKYLVYLGQGGLGLPERDYYLRDDERSTVLLTAYTEHVGTQLANLGEDEVEAAAESVVALEKRLAAASLPAEKLRDRKLTLNRFRVDKLDELMPEFGLTSYTRAHGVSSKSVNVDNPSFFSDLDQTLRETNFEVVRTYLRWHLVRKFASSLPARFEHAAFDFYGRTLGGQQTQRARWQRVLATASADIGEQVSRLYVDSEFSAEAKSRCEEMVGRLIEAMRSSIENLDWMTEDTRKAALTKLDSFGYKIGYPDEWRDYSGLEIGSDAFVANRIRCEVFEHERQFGRLDEPVDQGEWEMPAHVVNAYYHPLLNEIVFPAGILQPPFFYEDGDDALIYGGIGTVIGHEITHGFDDQGSQFDERGRFRSWWSEQDRAEFERRAEVVADQFSEYDVAGDQKLNGRLTLGENIADLGGLKLAYDAFTSTLDGDETEIGGMTPRQRFFVSYATIWRTNYTEAYARMLANVDVHSPSFVRVNGPLSNFPPFADAFEVEEQTPMRRPEGEHAAIW